MFTKTMSFFIFTIFFVISSCSQLPSVPSQSISEQYQAYASSSYYLKVKGMFCSTCTDGLEEELKKNLQVQSVEIDLENEEVFIRTQTSNSEIKEHIIKSLKTRGLELLLILEK